MGGGLTFSNSRSGSNSVSWLLIPFVRPRSEGATRCYNIHIIPFNPRVSRWLFIHFLFFFFDTILFLFINLRVCLLSFLYSYINWSVGGNCQFIIYIIIKLKKKNHLIIKFRVPKLDIDKFKFILISSICIAFVSSWRENYEVLGWRWRSIIGYALQLPKDCESGGLPRNMQSFMPMPLKQSIWLVLSFLGKERKKNLKVVMWHMK